MIILTLRTDNPTAEIGLYNNEQQLAYKKWHAHRELSATLLRQIHSLLSQQKLDWPALQGIIAYQGPGSFTGLRIGLTVANTSATELAVPIVGVNGTRWQEKGLKRLQAGENDKYILPEYGAPAHTTSPRK